MIDDLPIILLLIRAYKAPHPSTPARRRAGNPLVCMSLVY